MRRYSILGVVILLLLALAFVAWLLLSTHEQPGQRKTISDSAEEPPAQSNNAFSASANEPLARTPVPEPEPAADNIQPVPDTDPDVIPPLPERLSVEGRVTSITGESLRAQVYLFIEDPDYAAGETVCNADGTFSISLGDLTEIPAGAYVTAHFEDYLSSRDPASASMTITLVPMVITRVNVRIDGATYTPETAWLVWEDDPAGRQEGENFVDGVALIKLHRPRNAGPCRVFCNWFGNLLSSDVLTLDACTSHDVTLRIPAGAELLVTVIGPDGVPLPGAALRVSEAYNNLMLAKTGEGGEVLLLGFKAPSTWIVELTHVRGAQCITSEQTAEFVSGTDRRELRFDLSGTGTVDCKLTANGERLTRIDITPVNPAGQTMQYVWLGFDEEHKTILYGLAPGTYLVEAYDWRTDNTFAAEFEVLPPPALSLWQRDFVTRDLTVHVVGAGTAKLRLEYTAGGYAEIYVIQPGPTGDFLIPGLGSGQYDVRVWGQGWASEIHTVDPAVQSELTIEVTASGILKLTPRGKADLRLDVTGVEPERKTVSIQGSTSRLTDTLELPPGRYTVGRGWGGGGLWEPFEVVVKAGETSEYQYGPEYVSTLQMRTRDRTSMWDLEVNVEQEGVPLKVFQTQTFSSGDEYFSASFQAEGKLTLRITGTGIEDYILEFSIKRGETVTVEVELKQKQ